ncbi:MAG: hypothetical protein F6J86_16270 [Symploca sp. SIO1B1]|nr:hypothetical protein [Symploca sp. SIO1B1]
MGEYQTDLLTVLARVQNRTVSQMASSLLAVKVEQKLPHIEKRVQYLADKRGISFTECWNQLLAGTFKPISPEEFTEMQKDASDEN